MHDRAFPQVGRQSHPCKSARMDHPDFVLIHTETSREAKGVPPSPPRVWFQRGAFIFNLGVAHVCLGLANVGLRSKNRTFPCVRPESVDMLGPHISKTARC